MSTSGPSEEKAPFHILMSTERPLQEMLLRDDRLQNDYLTRRFQCLQNDGSQQQQQQPVDIWSAATPLERALTECCELGQNKDDDEDDSTVVPGALCRGKEGSFVRLLALYCHTPSTRALVLAILQRTIEQDELEEENQEEVYHVVKSKKCAETKPVGDKVEKPLPESANEKEQDNNEKSVDLNSCQEAEKSEKSFPGSSDNFEEEAMEKEDNMGRMGRFLAMGGLKILKQWLEDAMTPVKTVVPKAPPQASTAKQEASRVVLCKELHRRLVRCYSHS